MKFYVAELLIMERGQTNKSVQGDGVKMVNRDIAILASCDYQFIRVHKNLVQHPNINISHGYINISLITLTCKCAWFDCAPPPIPLAKYFNLNKNLRYQNKNLGYQNKNLGYQDVKL